MSSCLNRTSFAYPPASAAAQVIGLLRKVWEAAGLSLDVEPYGVLPTRYECGIIQVTASPTDWLDV